jgi:hypothetical protein
MQIKHKNQLLFLLLVMLIADFVLAQAQNQAPTQDQAQDQSSQFQKEAVLIVQTYAQTLKSKLISAMQSGGPTQAVLVCSEESQKIAKEISASSGWHVKRVSLKARNPLAKPDGWESEVLAGWQKTLSDKADTNLLKVSVQEDQVRVMKGIQTDGLCLTCHGTNIDAKLSEQIKQIYPNDQAIGYEMGALRGAFSLTKKLK